MPLAMGLCRHFLKKATSDYTRLPSCQSEPSVEKRHSLRDAPPSATAENLTLYRARNQATQVLSLAKPCPATIAETDEVLHREAPKSIPLVRPSSPIIHDANCRASLAFYQPIYWYAGQI